MPPGSLPGQPPTEGKATASLILGILSLLLCLGFVAGIPAIILGHMARTAIRQSMGRLKGDGMALAGLIMGYISSAASAVFLILFFAGIVAYLIPGRSARNLIYSQQQAKSEMRSINASQATYQLNYSGGFARDLATLGHRPGDSCPAVGTPEHACLLSNELGNPECTASAWCSKGGYKFRMQGADCKKNKCNSYLLLAIPEGPAGNMPALCSTDDMAIRSQPAGSSSLLPTNVAECRAWPAL